MIGLVLGIILCGTPSKEQAEMYKIHSDYRISQGLQPQKLDPGLCRLAQILANAQASNNEMYHSRWNYSENVAVGSSPKDTIKVWINSYGHRRNLLSKYPCVGFGYNKTYAASLHGEEYTGPDLIPGRSYPNLPRWRKR